MSKSKGPIYPLDYGISVIELMEGAPGRTGCYVVKGEQKNAIIETGSSLAAPYILAGLEELQIAPESIDYVIVTHIHLDHSGGVGYILPHFPNATVVVHPRGARHLIDPSRLVEGARAVYGAQLEEFFGTILPVPEERVLIREEGDTLDLGDGRIFTFYDTPGHAKHHFSIHDPYSEGIFSGDTVGIRYAKAYTGWGFEPIFPSTSPSDFDRDAVFNSCEKLEKLGAKRIYHTHFGKTEPASIAFERTRYTVDSFDRIARESFYPGMPWQELESKLREWMHQDLEQAGHPVDNLDALNLDLELNAKGILFVLEKEAK